MSKTRLLQAVCTVALLAAAPAFAQTNVQPADTGVGGAPNNPTANETMPNRSGSMAPADRMGAMGSHSGMDSHSTRHAAMDHRGRSADTSADQLNEQSYQAARSGQAYNGSGGGMSSGGSGMSSGSSGMSSGSSGSMNDMSGGSMSGSGSSGGGSMSGSGSSGGGSR
jgi:hypothetical protein